MVLSIKHFIANISLFSKALVLLCLMSLVACKKESKEDKTPKDVFVVGYESKGIYTSATIWKNGVATTLVDLNTGSGAESVFVDDIDVYVAGWESVGNKLVATVWKNGEKNSFNTVNSTVAEYIFKLNSDVYVAGIELIGNKYIIKLWKNGVASNVFEGTNNTILSGLYVFGNEVYVGIIENVVSVPVSYRFFKDAKEVTLPIGAFSPVSSRYYIANSDKYLATATYDPLLKKMIALLTKNNENYQKLTNGKYNAYCSSVFIYKNIVYTTGYEFEASETKSVAKYWTQNSFKTLTDSANNARALAIFVK